jgi:multidrug transporter EmrE-like cation transporter
LDNINWLAVIVAAVIHQALGALWYGPLFGAAWLAGMGKTREEVSGAGPAYAVSALASLIAAVALALFLTLPDSVSLGSGIGYGLVAGIGFAATTIVTQSVFEDKNRTVTWIYLGYQVVGLAVMGAILGAWR